jgi:hypothetical protein
MVNTKGGRITVTADLILYGNGGSHQIDLIEAMPVAIYEVKKRGALRYLKASWAPPGSIELLENFPFRLWDATNDFNDRFEVLYLEAGMDLYVEIEHEGDGWGTRIHTGIPQIADAFKKIGHEVRFVAVGLNLGENTPNVTISDLIVTSDVVEAALKDAETLIDSAGPANALDRVHTAFHAYLESACEKAGITPNEEAPITELFSTLRNGHPALAIQNPEHREKMNQIFRGVSKIIEALDSLRDRASLAHPNELLDNDEAMLAINVVRSMLRYLDSRLGH